MIKLYLAACTKASEHDVGKRLAEYALEDAFGARAELCHDERGKPHFVGAEVFVSISHSDGLCLVAVSDSEVGADIEKMNMDVARSVKLAERYFSKDETKYVRLCPSEHFFEIWCAKESYIKYTGEGLSRKLSSFSVIDSSLYFSTKIYNGYTIAVCSKERTEPEPIFVDPETLLRRGTCEH